MSWSEKVGLELGAHPDLARSEAHVGQLDHPRADQGAEQRGGVAALAGLRRVALVAGVDQPDDGRVVGAGLALEHREQQPVAHLEARAQHFGRTRDELAEGVLVPGHEALRRLLARQLALAALAGLLLQTAVLDHVLGRLADHAAVVVEALATGAADDLLELAHAQDPHLLAVVLRELVQHHRADRHVDAHAERVGAEDHPQQSLLGELLGEQPVLRQQPRVVHAHPVGEEALHVAPVGRVEAEVADRLANGPPVLGARQVRAGGALGELAALPLGEVHDVDRREVAAHQVFQGLVQGRLAVLVVEGDRAHVGMHVGDGRDRCGRPADARCRRCFPSWRT